ncbi:group I intron-associated PD-(D/E)XK endonuclease [Arcobacter vandammei]|uniref:group I intron-associated PD-(D/E)XK endonuclease n=1 Tax=Arcobacter vandammei TaxID=2782243 RepID=UPI0018E0227B|nr:group I intron-associated PD-(D/E)XK endonuclease [Arcobacter vandammei]
MNEVKLIEALKNENYKKAKVEQIANNFGLKKSDLMKFYTSHFFNKISKEINLQELSEFNIDFIEEKLSQDSKKEFDFIKTDLKKIIEKSLYIAMTNGFSTNLNHIESGVMTANAGDSAEFIFVARAILAGFNCSSVDVRSSRYDAIIDFEGILLRVQIKGISTGNTISFKDRDRGGLGIDHTHERNIGKRITSKDCDIYVAVDKQVGICYIIPMIWADRLSEEDCKSVKLNQIEEYKENWEIVKELAKKQKGTF